MSVKAPALGTTAHHSGHSTAPSPPMPSKQPGEPKRASPMAQLAKGINQNKNPNIGLNLKTESKSCPTQRTSRN